MSDDQPKLTKERAKELLDALPDDVSEEQMAHAIFKVGQFQNAMAFQNALQAANAGSKPTKSSVFREYAGCVFSILGLVALFLFIPLLFSLGEKVIGGGGFRVVKEGKVVGISADPEVDTVGLQGVECKVYSDWVWFDIPLGHDRMIPASHIHYLELR